MGSGSSKGKGGGNTSRETTSKSPPVANVNNNTSKDREAQSKSVIRTETESPKKSLAKDKHQENSRVESSSKFKKDDSKAPGKIQWDSDSDIGDDLDEFLGIPSSKNVPKTETRPAYNEVEQDLNSYNERKSQEHYPETYAQRHTRQQYTFGQDRLIREKTIYRNPEEWEASDSDDEEDIPNKKPTGFDASRFRAANTGQPVKEKDFFAANQSEFETPRYLRGDEPQKQILGVSNDHHRSRDIPQYTKDEEDMMAALMMDDFSMQIGHQAVSTAAPNVIRF